MRASILAIATFSLISCIPVDDFGAYWGKAGIDRRLVGSWKWIGAANGEDGALFGKQMRVIEINGTCEVTPYANGTKIDGGPFVVKTLKTGRYQFLAARFPAQKSGFVERYQIVGGRVLQLCEESIDQFVSTNYPQAVNIENPGDVGDVMSIALFDAEVFTILSNIPDTQTYWHCHQGYQRVQ